MGTSEDLKDEGRKFDGNPRGPRDADAHIIMEKIIFKIAGKWGGKR